MKEFKYTIKDPVGIHARPAGLLVKELTAFSSNVSIHRGEDSCDGKKLLAMMKLRVKQGEEIILRVEGPDEDAATAAAKAFIESTL
ncbi:phosphocarrier protein HPr [Treponema primitia ZAS-2]|uniref:Phosphocarrier protein HPr n=1 Tax=Treponema primitia (strain ATCC BAA-887 / DSM 12427 / ZAS-2) TaxID=545694 RepID=F5YP52_TREPZ|nr:HPr family phosphocarrier protein [Treponema primitia]AEF84312.1 phosphocarrier protein HPr [Treponema primitia ZAS-2]